MAKLKIASIGSSSSGNSYLISDGNTRLLLDVGLAAKKIKEGLAACRLDVGDIKGIFVTHEHTDHVKSIRAIAQACDNAKVYASRGTAYSCDKFEHVRDGQLEYMSAQDEIIVGDIRVKAFSLSHDAVEPLGFSFFTDEDQLTVATDTGIVTDEIENEVLRANKLVLEANHEENILQMGPYPYSLKRRILGDYGHLSNVTSGITLANSLLKRQAVDFLNSDYSRGSDSERSQSIMLAHLSSQNNTPEQAILTVSNILSQNELKKNSDFNLKVAAKDSITIL